MQNVQTVVAVDSLAKAKHYINLEDWARAFAHLMVVFELAPSEKSKYGVVFENVMHNLSLKLESENRFEDLFKSYNQAIRYFPDNLILLNDFGSYLLRVNHPEIAMGYFKAALEIDSSFLLAEKNLQTSKLNILPRWHFRMLNDNRRNESYFLAIRKAITASHNKVLDIGTGCGLLSYFATEIDHVQRIIAVESSEVLATIAKNCLRNHNYVNVINDYSIHLSSSNIGLSKILITEIFDAALFGEHALETLIHAWENLLEPSAKIIPCGAHLYITGINIGKYVIVDPRTFGLENVCIKPNLTEPYDAESLKQKKDVKYITKTEIVLHVDFRSVQQLKEIFLQDDYIPPITLRCLEDGIIDALTVWFDLHLDNVITITTNPKDDCCIKCWEQAVIYLDHQITVLKDQCIKLQISYTNNVLKATLIDNISSCQSCIKISPDLITFLNDKEIINVAKSLTLPDQFNCKDCVVLDLNPVPVFALHRAKNNVFGHYISVGMTKNDCAFLNLLWAKNVNKNCTSITYEVIHQQDLHQKMKKNSLDVIFINPISENGILAEDIFNKLAEMKASLKRHGLLLPKKLYILGHVVHSNYISHCSKIAEHSLFGFEAVHEMNKYAILEQWQLQFNELDYKSVGYFSEEVNIFSDDPFMKQITVQITGDANINSILYGFKLIFNNDLFLDTFSSSYYNNACFLFECPERVTDGNKIVLTIVGSNGLLKISYTSKK